MKSHKLYICTVDWNFDLVVLPEKKSRFVEAVEEEVSVADVQTSLKLGSIPMSIQGFEILSSNIF